MSAEAEPTGGAPTPKLSIRTRCASVDTEGISTFEAFALWERAARVQAELDKGLPAGRLEGGSVSGFQFEQASEALHDGLPGGWAR